jgi:2-methylcitrate dehydratase PrpD
VLKDRANSPGPAGRRRSLTAFHTRHNLERPDRAAGACDGAGYRSQEPGRAVVTPSAFRFGEFATGLRLAEVPEAVRRRATWIVADSIAAIAAGHRVPEMRRLAARRAEAAGVTRLIGTPHRAALAEAAFLNGTAGTWLELNEGHLASRGHPAIHVLPAIWALAEARGASGADLLTALIAGYEIGARIGRASRLREAVHPHGTFGTVGAAIACARLAGLDAGGVAAAANLAATLGLATSRRTLVEGATVRNVYAGTAARAGLLALDLREAGFTPEADGIGSAFGRVYADSFDAARAVEGLGTEWMTASGYIKLHPCGRYLHSALDLAEALLSRHGPAFDATRIASIDIAAYHPLSMLGRQDPDTSFAARFSAPFAVASLLVAGRRDLANFEDGALADPRRRALARRITVAEEPAFTAAYPARQPCRMTVTWTDGTQAILEAQHIRGEAENPHDEADLVAKFHAVCDPLWGEAASQGTLARLLAIEEVQDIARLEIPVAPHGIGDAQ